MSLFSFALSATTDRRRSASAGVQPQFFQPIEPLEQRQLLAATRIMPLGDSITSAFAPQQSYRYWLWNSLQNAGFNNVDFVGTQRGVVGGSPANSNFDLDHEGHSGWRADELAAQAESWARTARPDIVLVHAGTNDVRANQSAASTIRDLELIIDRLRAANPTVTILFAKIIPAQENISGAAALNDAIPTLVQQKNTSQSRVILIDQASGFDLARDTHDGLHPNESGEKKMAARFFNALQPILNQPPPAPAPPPPPVHVPLTGTTFLGELTPMRADNAVGPIEVNQHNGGSGAQDGGRMSIRGRDYARGIGTQATSRVDYRLDGKQKWFIADLGLDDSTSGRGSVVFKVYLDGKRVFSSHVIDGDDPIEQLRLRIAGGRKLTLIVSDAGDGNTDDRANWANARVVSYHPDVFV
jgi:lysophospholipase L1-like esterase